MVTTNRSHTSGNFALDIDGYNVGYLKKFSGLNAEADIATNDLGPDNIQMKQVTNMKWSDAKATVGIGMGKGMYEWIKSAFDKSFVTKTGSLTAANFDFKAQSRMDFDGALITEVTVPKLVGDGKEAAYFDIGFAVEHVKWSKASGEDIRAKIGQKQKAWLNSMFRVELGNLPCSRVHSVDSFTWKCSVVTDAIGEIGAAYYTKHPAKVTVPDLKLAISHADYDPWAQAARAWFVDGLHHENHHMTGRVVFLSPDAQEIGSVNLDGVGFKKIGTDDNEANAEKIKRFTVELYVEKMTFQIDHYDA